MVLRSMRARAPAWFQSAIPIELGAGILSFGVGLAQAFIVYGLWTRKHWSSSLLLKAIAMAAIINLGAVLLYSSYPQELVVEFGPMPVDASAVGFIIAILWFFVCRWYTAKPHVKEYLGQIL